MHPTIDEQLRGADRLIQKAESTASLTAEAVELLTNARRLLAHVTRSWSALPQFHHGDNDAMAELLAGLAPLVPELEPEIVAATVPPPDVGDAASTAERNTSLRELLSSVIRALPSTPAGDEARVRVGAYLLHRIDNDPA